MIALTFLTSTSLHAIARATPAPVSHCFYTQLQYESPYTNPRPSEGHRVPAMRVSLVPEPRHGVGEQAYSRNPDDCRVVRGGHYENTTDYH